MRDLINADIPRGQRMKLVARLSRPVEAEVEGRLAFPVTLAILTPWQKQLKGGDPMSNELRAVASGLGMHGGQRESLSLS